ncbi:MAG: glycosyltransferase family 4 protein [Candidatus Hydrogenedentes bacterium]|nr:glycosyltransferase family 4 protein [Candidatus Hydrogenedentota bacterium]
MRRYRVGHVITRLCVGGAQENTFHTVRLADRARFDVDLISGPTEGPEGSIEPEIEKAGIEILRVPHLVRPVAPQKDWRALKELTALFRERNYDIVHTHTSKAGLLGRLAARRAGVPAVVHTPHGHVFDGYFSKPVTRIFIACERYAAKRTDRLIALTQHGLQDHLEQRVGRLDQWTVIFSGIDLSPFKEARLRRKGTRSALGVGPDDILIGGVGRFEHVKGFTYFVEAAKAIAEVLPQACFVLAGDGSLARVLHEQARPLGERFIFLGWRGDIPDLMAALDIFVLPSLNEGMGRVLLEAAAAGVPAVASYVGGVPEVVHEGETGYLVPPGESQAIAEKVLLLVRDTKLRTRMGAKAKERVAPYYGLEKMVERIEALYKVLMDEKRIDS